MRLLKQNLALLAAVMLLLMSLLVTVLCGHTEQALDYDQKILAAQKMQDCMQHIASYKQEMGIALSAEDSHATGLIGDYFTGITTTIGAIEAKRTVSDSNMAALVVELMHEAGVRKGDKVAACFSGSFPGMNLAVLCACEAMDVDTVYIASVGSSMYGANQPQLTFPDMLERLISDGCLTIYPAAFSMGGDWDCGEEMDPETAQPVRARVKGYGIQFLEIRDLAENVAVRKSIYDRGGGPVCYIGVGGNVANIGRNDIELGYGVLKPDFIKTTNKESGLIEVYSAQGIPVINLLNIKMLMTQYHLPYDPQELQPIGQGVLYHTVRYPAWPAVCGCLAAGAVLVYVGKKKGRWRQT